MKLFIEGNIAQFRSRCGCVPSLAEFVFAPAISVKFLGLGIVPSWCMMSPVRQRWFIDVRPILTRRDDQLFKFSLERYQDDLKQFWTTKIRVFLFSEASVDFLPGPLNDFLVGNVRIHALCRVTSPVWLTGRAALCQLVFSYSCCTCLMTQPPPAVGIGVATQLQLFQTFRELCIIFVCLLW